MRPRALRQQEAAFQSVRARTWEERFQERRMAPLEIFDGRRFRAIRSAFSGKKNGSA
jgi:hypothetical protein